MILLFTIVCIFGGFVLHWRRASLTGYFGSPANVPGIFTYGLGSLLVWAVGFFAYWGAALVLAMASDWLWAGLALFFGFTLRSPILRVICGPPRTVLAQDQSATQTETHFKVIVKKRLRWHGRLPIPDESGDFIAPGGAVQEDWAELSFPPPFGEYGQETRYYTTFNGDEFERLCKKSTVVLAFERVDRDAWRRAAGDE